MQIEARYKLSYGISHGEAPWNIHWCGGRKLGGTHMEKRIYIKPKIEEEELDTKEALCAFSGLTDPTQGQP